MTSILPPAITPVTGSPQIKPKTKPINVGDFSVENKVYPAKLAANQYQSPVTIAINNSFCMLILLVVSFSRKINNLSCYHKFCKQKSFIKLKIIAYVNFC